MNLKTLSGYTTQQVFDFVKNHLLAQNKKSFMPNGGGCAYRGDGGSKCAVGCLISDDEYDPKFESKEVCRLYSGRHLEILVKLQNLHDSEDIEDWETKLKSMADDHGLVWELDE